MVKHEVPELIRALQSELKERYKDCKIRLLNGNYGGVKGTIFGNLLEDDGHMYRIGCRIACGEYMTEAVFYPDSKIGRETTIECGSKRFDIRTPGSLEGLLDELDRLVTGMRSEL